MPNSRTAVNLSQMIVALETVVDLVGISDVHHAKRVGYIASQIAHALSFSQEDIRFAFELGLLHDCGVSTEQMHKNLISQFEWQDSYVHCEIGYQLLRDFEPLSAYAEPLPPHAVDQTQAHEDRQTRRVHGQSHLPR